VTTLTLQVARRHAEIAALQDDLQKYLVLSDLQALTRRFYYSVLMSDPATYMPIVYYADVGEACQKFGHIFRAPRGVYLPISARGRLNSCSLIGRNRTCASSSSPTVSAFSVSADLGAGGMAFPSASSRSITACAGVPPQ